MSENEMNEAIALVCGWKWEIRQSYRETPGWYSPANHGPEDLPNYCGDLNAMHEAEKMLLRTQAVRYRMKLSENSDGPKAFFATVESAMCHATARQRAEAFLKTVKPT